MVNQINNTNSFFTNETLREELVQQNYNAVILGQAGCGKSTLIREICMSYNPDGIILCAPTGTAAKKIGGKTIHKVFGIKKHRKVDYNSPEMTKLNYATILIVDEVSMLSASLLTLIDSILRITRNNLEEPFGGMRVLLFGDLKQLQPVPDEDSEEDQNPDISFYNAPVIQGGHFKFFHLKHNYRQEEDKEFKLILNEFRENNVSNDTIQKLNKHYNPELSFNPNVRYLTSTNRLADYINNQILQRQEGELFEVKREVFYETDIQDSTKHYADFQDRIGKEKVPIIVHFKIGSPVMFFKNDSDSNGNMRYTNGTVGIVRKVFLDNAGIPENVQIELEDETCVLVGKETFDFDGKWNDDHSYFHLGTIRQFPFNVSFATTIDKAQGQTLHQIAVVLGRRARPNLVYVAISRVRRLEDLIVEYTPISRSQIIMSSNFEDFIAAHNIRLIEVS